MVELIESVTAERVRSNLARVMERIAATGRDPASVEVLAAVKYLTDAGIDVLHEAGLNLVGENRAQQLKARAPDHPELIWDFIGALQSRKVAQILPLVRYIHSVASDSVLDQLAKHGDPNTQILVQVNVAGEAGKAGIAPGDLPDFVARCPVKVVGLMTMPPLADGPEPNRRHFAALAELAAEHNLTELSMGTSQDYESAAREGATIIRLGSILFR